MKKLLGFIFPLLPLSFIFLFEWILSFTLEENMEENFDQEEYEDERYIKIAIVEDKAYWVIHNVLYEADVVDGEIEKEYARPVDAFDMDYRDVTKLMSILDNMQDWKN
jgi:hypothetical protein